MIDENRLKTALRQYWNYTEFRDAQLPIMQAVLSGTDAVALLPTGGGKSLCYQLPAIVSEGICLVVSPLLALIKDQVHALVQRNIGAAFISSEQDELQQEQVWEDCRNGYVKLLYVSPERLQSQAFINNLQELQLSFIAVDEAHCISEWGSDFRPSYHNIAGFRMLFPHLPCLALTATATDKIAQEIIAKLSLQEPAVFRTSYRRHNLQLIFRELSDKYPFVQNYLRSNSGAGIIYCRTRQQTEDLSKWLKARGESRVDYFHAGLIISEKLRRQKEWLLGSDRVLISTNAFGMGIDKENVDFILHLSPPASIENYYQEVGRAGRSGRASQAVILWNEQELSAFDELLFNQIPNKKEYLRIISYVYSAASVAEGEQSEEMHQLNFDKIRSFTKLSRAKILAVLQFLHNQDVIYLKETKGPSYLELLIDSNHLDQLPPKDVYFIELLLRTVSGLSSHGVSFSETAVCNKLNVEPVKFKERLSKMHSLAYLKYFDGSSAGIRFLKPRDDRTIAGKYWKQFLLIQKSKLRKWEEMKYLLRSPDFCKMKLILAYFDEKAEDCGKCSYCLNKTGTPVALLRSEITARLSRRPQTFQELSATMPEQRGDELLEELKQMLDDGVVRMLNFKTYTI